MQDGFPFFCLIFWTLRVVLSLALKSLCYLRKLDLVIFPDFHWVVIDQIPVQKAQKLIVVWVLYLKTILLNVLTEICFFCTLFFNDAILIAKVFFPTLTSLDLLILSALFLIENEDDVMDPYDIYFLHLFTLVVQDFLEMMTFLLMTLILLVHCVLVIFFEISFFSNFLLMIM